MTGWSKFSLGKLRRPQVIGLAVAVLVAAGSIYGIGAFKRNAGDGICRPALAKAKRLAPLVKGEIAAVNVAGEANRLPKLAFTDASGAPKTLADWRGRTVLFNLWATWCVPCRKEMPALAALQKELGSDAFEVVTVNIDTRDPHKPEAWLREVGVTGLAYYADPNAKVFQDLKGAGKAFGMPTTLLIDPNGCELASLAGPAEWASAEALAFVRAALAN